MSVGGFSKPRLSRVRDVMSGYVERGAVPGVVTLVTRRGELHVDALGTQALGSGQPMRRDAIFRISSMTKPIIAAATMVLVEECMVRLDEPVDRLLPELAGRKVLKRIDAPLDDTVPASRPITVRDLLTFRMGLGIVMAPPDTYPIQTAMEELSLGQGMPSPSTPPPPEEWIRRLGTLPLMHQGGHGHDPDDAGIVDLPQSSRYLSRFLDFGLPGDRRLVQVVRTVRAGSGTSCKLASDPRRP